jgi:hypothetical protein
VPRAPVWLFPCLAIACATAPPPLPAGATAEPVVGDPLALLLTKLHYAEGAPAEIELRELRVVSVERQPWRTLEPAAAGAEPGVVGVIAGRRCHWREGLHSEQVDRASWFLLERGTLRAFDHQGFGARCAGRPAFEPAAPEQVALERSLMRYSSQRWPVAQIPGEERLARGMRLLARDRVDDARFELFALSRRISELERRQSEQETPDAAEREQLREEEEQLRPLRAQLQHALEDHVTTKGEQP